MAQVLVLAASRLLSALGLGRLAHPSAGQRRRFTPSVGTRIGKSRQECQLGKLRACPTLPLAPLFHLRHSFTCGISQLAALFTREHLETFAGTLLDPLGVEDTFAVEPFVGVRTEVVP